MSLLIFNKLLAIFLTVALGWAAGRMRWLGEPAGGLDPSRLLGNAAYYIFVPALLFRTTARLDMAAMPWATVLAFFLPVMLMLLGVYAFERWHRSGQVQPDLAASEQAAAAPTARAIAVVFGNSVQVGIPIAFALFGEAGLGIHIALVSLHALLLLTALTALAEIEERTRQLAESLGLACDFRQTNHEGVLVDWIQEAARHDAAVVINPAGLSFRSVPVLDALKLVLKPVIEVHITNIHQRPAPYTHSLVSPAATGVICGLGPIGYLLAVRAVADLLAAKPAQR